jgi:sugar lactone lactonase YvrE
VGPAVVIGALRTWTDQLLGRGAAAITVPIFDGALKPNQVLEQAETFAELEAPEDLATDGNSLFVADGTRVLRYDGDTATTVAAVERRITGLAVLPGGGLAVALDGTELRVIGGPNEGRTWSNVAGKPLHAANAICATTDGRLLVTDGSQAQPYDRWCHDLMSLGRSGRVLELRPADGSASEIVNGLAYAFGAISVGRDVWVCESWAHRVVAYADGKRGSPVIGRLPCYPSRLAPAASGGYWLTAFTARTQLVEFVLRQKAYRTRMMKEIDPRYWIAPALTSGNTFLEPLQGAHLKMRGIHKPWAPPRSYGLVMRLSVDGLIQYSLHSRVDGKNHGIVAAVECQGTLFALAKGRRRIVSVPVADIERRLLS